MNTLRHILLVEDSPRDAELTINALKCVVANEIVHLKDGAEALEYLFLRGDYASRANEPPAVILLDLKMPKVDGYDVLREVKSDPALKNIPVVIMTSSREEQDLVRTYAAGVNAYVVKPLKFPEFAEAVRQLGVFWAAVNVTAPPAADPR